MGKLTELRKNLDEQRDLAYLMIRIFIGGALFVRGIAFLSDPSAITSLAGAQNVYMWYSYIIAGHVIGGMMLAMGLFTRLAALVQLPIVFGAVLFIHLEQGLLTVGQSLELASLVLFLLAIFLAFGSGKLSVHHRLAARHQTANA